MAKRKKPRKAGPTGPSAKAWTDWMTPLRVRKVPRRVAAKARVTKAKFQVLKAPRVCWTKAVWRKAVARSQGMKLAFSTGSQAQYPPQPRTS